MNTKKTNTKKTTKPAFTVDITACNDLYNTALAFAIAKQKAGIPLTDENIDIIITAGIDTFGDILDELGYIHKENHFIAPVVRTLYVTEKEEPKKKENIFKRFWNWIIGK